MSPWGQAMAITMPVLGAVAYWWWRILKWVLARREEEDAVNEDKWREPEWRCSSCGRGTEHHQDEWGRWQPCLERIGDTLAYHERYREEGRP